MGADHEVAEHVRESRFTEAAGTAENTEAAVLSQGTKGKGAPEAVLCIAGRTELDGAVTAMLAQILTDEAGIPSRVLPASAIGLDALGRLDLSGVEVVCLSYFHPRPEVYARYVCRRLKRRFPKLKIVVGLWSQTTLKAGAGEDVARALTADAVASSIGEVRRYVEAWLPSHPVSL